MSMWFTCNLGDAMLAGESLEHIRELFMAGCEKTGSSDEMAVFVRHVSEGRLHCEVRVYFSPATAHLADAFDAIACKKPDPEGLGLLLGSEQAWSVFFPKSAVGEPKGRF